jgi:hypothetical protein
MAPLEFFTSNKPRPAPASPGEVRDDGSTCRDIELRKAMLAPCGMLRGLVRSRVDVEGKVKDFLERVDCYVSPGLPREDLS